MCSFLAVFYAAAFDKKKSNDHEWLLQAIVSDI